MARMDHVDSGIGVVRGTLAADLNANLIGVPVAVSLNASGLVVLGTGGQGGCLGIVIISKFARLAGQRVDIFKHGEALDCVGLAAGTKYYANATTGALEASAGTTSKVFVGTTVEADRLVLSGFSGVTGPSA